MNRKVPENYQSVKNRTENRSLNLVYLVTSIYGIKNHKNYNILVIWIELEIFS